MSETPKPKLIKVDGLNFFHDPQKAKYIATLRDPNPRERTLEGMLSRETSASHQAKQIGDEHQISVTSHADYVGDAYITTFTLSEDAAAKLEADLNDPRLQAERKFRDRC